MSKVFIIIFIIFFSKTTFAQEEINIKKLSRNINTIESEFNFVQINSKEAYYTFVPKTSNGVYQANIYKTIKKQNNWQKGFYAKQYNSEIFNTANFSLDTTKGSQEIYLSMCNEKKCKIAKKKSFLSKPEIIKNPKINTDNNNTQPFIGHYKNRKVLYFVSDRKGGFGGYDIWISFIDNMGNFGSPINLGKNINTKFNEITPFYNKNTETLYFSSDRDGGNGGFDIYSSEQKKNSWGEPKNNTNLNTEKDEMYLNFYSKYKGYFSSNRNSECLNIDSACCTDIYSFEYLQPKKNLNIDSIKTLLPITLYFDNDEPDCCTMDTTTLKTYKDTYISYFKKEAEYILRNKNQNNFFEEKLKNNFNKLEKIISLIHTQLIKGDNIELVIRGFSSPLFSQEYNINLSKRRISSVINYLISLEKYMFKEFLQTKKMRIKRVPFGETQSLSNVSDNPKEKEKSIYSFEAMIERRIEIMNVKIY